MPGACIHPGQEINPAGLLGSWPPFTSGSDLWTSSKKNDYRHIQIYSGYPLKGVGDSLEVLTQVKALDFGFCHHISTKFFLGIFTA